jgi:hypothetical protein
MQLGSASGMMITGQEAPSPATASLTPAIRVMRRRSPRPRNDLADPRVADQQSPNSEPGPVSTEAPGQAGVDKQAASASVSVVWCARAGTQHCLPPMLGELVQHQRRVIER